MFCFRWGIAWTFATKDEIDLSTAPVIRTRTEVQKLKKDKSMEIIFPARENLSSLDKLVTALKKWITELKVSTFLMFLFIFFYSLQTWIQILTSKINS